MSKTIFSAGVDVGGTKTAYAIFDGEKQLVKKRIYATEKTLAPERFVEAIAQNLRELCKELGGALLSGIGVVLPSFIGTDGFVHKTANLPMLHGFYAHELLGKAFPECAVAVKNDNHAAALAEYRYGAGRGSKNMLYCLMSTGLASGIIINGRLFDGSRGLAGESGHMLITPEEGLLCGCGNRGCIESYASGSKIAEHVKLWLENGEVSVISEIANGAEITAEHIDAAYQMGDALAERAIEQMTRYMAIWLYNLYITLNIDRFVFGGGLLKMKAPLLELVRSKFDELTSGAADVSFCITELGDDAGVFSANCLLED